MRHRKSPMETRGPDEPQVVQPDKGMIVRFWRVVHVTFLHPPSPLPAPLEDPTTSHPPAVASAWHLSARSVRLLLTAFFSLLWFGLIALGLIQHVSVDRDAWRQHALHGYDGALRRVGPLLPFIPFSLRATGSWLLSRLLVERHARFLHNSSSLSSSSPPSTLASWPLLKPLASSHGAARRRLQGLLECLAVYLVVIVVRICIYLAHRSHDLCSLILISLSTDPTSCDSTTHWMSDHVLLAASMTALLLAECVLGWSPLLVPLLTMHHWQEAKKRPDEGVELRAREREALLVGPSLTPPLPPRRSRVWFYVAQTLLFLAPLVALVLFSMTCGDMYLTARYFHERFETITAVLLGAVLFHLPMAHWLQHRRLYIL